MKRHIALVFAALLLTSCTEAADSRNSRDITKAQEPEIIREESSDSDESFAVSDAQDEDFPKEYELDFDNTEISVISKAELLVKAPTGYSSLEGTLDRDVLSSGTVGLVGSPVEIELEGANGIVTFTVDTQQLGDIPFENLIVLKSGHGMSFDEVASAVKDDKISFEITESDTYMLVDSYQWRAAWGDVDPELEHETAFRVGDLGFSLTIPKGVAPNSVSDYWHAEHNGEHQMMSKQLMHQNQQKDADIKAELYAWRYPNEEDDCDDPAPYMSFDERIEQLRSIDSDIIKIESTKEWELGNGRKGFAVVFHYPADAEKGIGEQTTVEGFYEYSDDTYILYTLTFYSYEQETVDACLKSVESFKYYQ